MANPQRPRNHRITNRWKGIKLQTMVAMSMGISVMVLFGVEPVLYQQLISEDDPSLELRATLSSPPITQNVPWRPHQKAKRHGMLPRTALRAKVPPSHKIELDAPMEAPNSLDLSMSSIRTYPRVVVLSGPFNATYTPPNTSSRQVEPMGRHRHESTSHVTPEYTPLPFERPFLEQCEPYENPTVHPSCNKLHELAWEEDNISLLSTKGSWRTAWSVQQNQTTLSDQAVLKALHWNRKFTSQAYQQHQLDVMVSDVLSASPHVIDSYGFCGQSVLQEWAPSGGRDYVKSYELRDRQRLKIARDLAKGLADVQALRPLSISNGGKYYLASSSVNHTSIFAHNDINIANTVHIDGKVKWNDFNIGVLLRAQKGTDGDVPCNAPVLFRSDMWRSPEEVRNTTYVQLEQTDMYGFGNILYQVMSRHQPWTHKEPGGKLTTEQIVERKVDGYLPTIPEKIKNSTKVELKAMLLATVTCYHPEPSKRLSAFELAHALSIVYDRLEHKQKVSTQLLRSLFLK